MILEVAQRQVRDAQEPAFDAAFNQAQAIIASMPGYFGYSLQRCIEHEGQYVLLVKWATPADHETGFQQSAQYQ